MSDFWKTAADWGRKALIVAEAVTRHQELVRLLSYDRETGMNLVAHLVQSQPAHVLDEWESAFLEIASTSIVEPAQRRRAMELYAWMKIQELGHYGQFRGFA